MSIVCIYLWHMPCLFAKLFHRHNCPVLLIVKNKVFHWNSIHTFSVNFDMTVVGGCDYTYTLFNKTAIVTPCIPICYGY